MELIPSQINGILFGVSCDLFGDAKEKVAVVLGQLGLLHEGGILESFLHLDYFQEVIDGEVQAFIGLGLDVGLVHGIKIVNP